MHVRRQQHLHVARPAEGEEGRAVVQPAPCEMEGREGATGTVMLSERHEAVVVADIAAAGI